MKDKVEGREKATALRSLQNSQINLDRTTVPLSNPTLYRNEVPVGVIEGQLVDRVIAHNQAAQKKLDAIDSKKPRNAKQSDGMTLKCLFSPYSFHRFARAHKEKMRDGSVIMVLRCRYCTEFQQIVIHWVKKNGKYIAMKETQPLEEYNEKT